MSQYLTSLAFIGASFVAYNTWLMFHDCFYIFEINSLSVASFAIIFSHSEGCLFTLFIVSFIVQKLLSLIRSHLFIFCFYFQYSGRWVIEDPAVRYVRECFAYVLSGLLFRSLIHFEFIFVYGVRK